MNNSKDHFAKIYREHLWGGESKSGPGSDPKLVQPYLNLLMEVIKKKRIRSVVDIGCGDWALARTIDWAGLSYVGIDIVPELIERLQHTYGSNNVRFVCADLVSHELPTADLCIIKDVLQHLSNDSVKGFLTRLDHHFKYAVITNDMIHKEQGGWRSLWKANTLPANGDIPDGSYRPLRLTEPPFHLRARRVRTIPLRFRREVFGHSGVVHETKEVLLWERNNH